MTKKFFAIVRVFSFSIAFLALAVSILLGFTSGYAYFQTVNESVKISNVSVQQFLNEESAKITQIESEVSLSESKEDDVFETNEQAANREFQAQLRSLFDRIMSSLEGYAKKADQLEPNEKGLSEYFIDNTEQLNGQEYLQFLETFSIESSKLLQLAERAIEANPEAPEHVLWTSFVAWFTTGYMENYNSELQRIRDEKAKIEGGKSTSLVTAASAAVGFLVFVFFTMILLLVQIEINTRVSRIRAENNIDEGIMRPKLSSVA